MPEDTRKGASAAGAEYYSFEKVLKELQMEEDDLKRLVSEGEIRAFRDEDKMKFRRSDIDSLKKGRMAEPTIILPSGDHEEGEDSEVLLVEEDTSETILEVDDLDKASSASTSFPKVELSSPEMDESVSSSSFGNVTEELKFEQDSDNYILDSSDQLMPAEDEPKQEEVSSDPEMEDTGMQTEALRMEEDDLNLDSAPSFKTKEAKKPKQEEITSEPELEPVEPIEDMENQEVQYISQELPTMFVVILILSFLTLIYGGVFAVNTLKEIDTNATGVLTDTAFKSFPTQHYKKSMKENEIRSHLTKREAWRRKAAGLGK